MDDRFVHVIGAQRSGTNFVVELVRENLTDRVYQTGDRSLSWKHALPSESRGASQVAGTAIRQSDALICVVVKHPIMWASSILYGGGHDLFIKRPGLLDSNGAPRVDAVIEFYVQFYQEWLGLLDIRKRDINRPFYLCRYEDALANPESMVRALGDLLGLKVGKPVVVPSVVPYSRKPSEAELADSRRGHHKLSLEQTVTIESLLDHHALLLRLGYCLSTVG